VVRSELLDHLVRYVSNSQSGNESKRFRRVIRPKRVHHDLIFGHAKRVSEGFGDEIEHLGRGNRLFNDEGVVQRVLVGQLNQSRVFRFCAGNCAWCDGFGQI
jgi:hypothetical protein